LIFKLFVRVETGRNTLQNVFNKIYHFTLTVPLEECRTTWSWCWMDQRPSLAMRSWWWWWWWWHPSYTPFKPSTFIASAK